MKRPETRHSAFCFFEDSFLTRKEPKAKQYEALSRARRQPCTGLGRTLGLPLVVGSAVERNSTGIRMHVHHSRCGLIGTEHDAVKLWHPILGVGHGVGWYGAEIAGLL